MKLYFCLLNYLFFINIIHTLNACLFTFLDTKSKRLCVNTRVYSLIFNLIPPILNLYFVGARNFVIFTKTIKIGTHPKINQSLVMIVLFIKYKYMYVKSSLNNQILGAKYGAFRNLNNTTKIHNFNKIIWA